jgi:hypothetical protein
MMKRIVTTLLVMSMVAAANAGLTVVIQDDAGGWQSYPDSEYTITPSTEIVWGVLDDGLTPTGTYVLGIVGPGSITDPTAVASGVTALLTDDAITAADYGVQNPYIAMDLTNSVGGLLYTSTFHCEGEGDVTLYGFNQNYLVVDTQVIHQVPEPATLTMLGIGGLLLRKRRRA